jgi:acid phosphatase
MRAPLALSSSLAGLLAAGLLAACGSSAGHPAPTTGPPSGRTSVTTAGPTTTASSAVSGAATTSNSTTPSARRPGALPRPDHVVIVVLENHSLSEVIGRPQGPFLAGLAAHGALFTNFFAIRHPSEPNYLALFSGSTQGLTSDACPVTYSAPNLGHSLLTHGRTFTGYAEGLPHAGFTGCTSGDYARRHCPWISFSDVPPSRSLPMTAFPRDLTSLPTVAFVIPDLQHDMHDGTLAQADSWLRRHLSAYAAWAPRHNSLLIVTADEDDGSADNRIPTVITGAHVKAGHYGQRYTLYSLLRTVEDMYALPRLGHSASAPAITGVWS